MFGRVDCSVLTLKLPPENRKQQFGYTSLCTEIKLLSQIAFCEKPINELTFRISHFLIPNVF